MWVCSLCRLLVAKNHNFWPNFAICGAPVPPPFAGEGQISCARADPRSTLTCQISFQLVYSVAFWRRKTPIFAVFWTSAFTGVASWWQSEKVENGSTTTNFPLSNGIRIVSVLQRLHGEFGRTNSDVHKRNEQTDKKSTFLAAPAAGGAGEIRTPPNLAWW